ncbi:hypothetical protein PDE_04458 [Penicillium oxalicum 114-2]|uniref:Terpene synthase n=1 Tax=Penicillium oxalicum (strain 114-2 / CGMCC 5302) TaxID=933388 RepID=S8ATP4_PENO1|nr:hypothetical protein PDE_04458 [Penicillium oxalicum 114-2]
MTVTHTENALEAIQGQTFVIPSFLALFGEMSSPLHGGYACLRRSIDELIPRSDFALLGCLWWPNVDLDALRLLTHLALWYLVWDDEMESKYLGVEGDLTAADKFRSQTRTVIAMSLGLAQEDRAIIEGAPHLIQQFYPLGGRIRSQISQGNLVLLLEMVDNILDDSKKEQHFVVTRNIPSIEQYWDYRTGTNLMEALYPVTSLAISYELTVEEMRNPLLREYWEQINKTIALINDILSFKKEIVRQSDHIAISVLTSREQEKKETLNLVFLKYLELGCLQSAIDSTVGMLINSVGEMRRLKSKVLLGTEPHVHRLIETWDLYAVGFLHWSLITIRYGLDTFLQEDGTFIVSLSETFD